MRVIKVNKKRGNIVLSRKALLEEENAEKKKHTLETLEPRARCSRGVVKNITDYGAFIDLGGIDGLLHITDMSWGRVNHPSSWSRSTTSSRSSSSSSTAATERVSLGHKQLNTRIPGRP